MFLIHTCRKLLGGIGDALCAHLQAYDAVSF